MAAAMAENHRLRAELDRIAAHQAMRSQAGATMLRGGSRLLVPLLDRAKVVRSFSKLATTLSNFGGPTQQWPSRDDIIVDARVFMESCIRFTIRRRAVFWLFSLFLAVIPLLQLWVVFRQNNIIENQNEFFEIQVHDVVSRSMTEGDRNARLMTGALLSRAKLKFLADVVDEAFYNDVTAVASSRSLGATTLRLEDAAFRGYLIRAVTRGIELRADRDTQELYAEAQPMLHKVLRDAADRAPAILRLGEPVKPGTPRGEKTQDQALSEQVANYFTQLGAAVRVYGRLARLHGDQEAFQADLAPLLRRVATAPLTGNRFADAYRFAFVRVLHEIALEPKLGDPPIDWERVELDPSTARTRGLELLREQLGQEALAWDKLAAQLADQE